MAWFEVATEEEIQPGSKKKALINNQKIVVFNVDGKFYATENKCSHQDAPLSNGIMHGKEVECSWHGSRFDVTTGAVTTLPAAVLLKTFITKVEDGKILVEI